MQGSGGPPAGECSGLVALVTGASKGGTGTAIALRLAAEGAAVALVARDRDGLAATADRITVVLRGAPPQTLAPWLSQVRLQARVVATQASLTRGPAGWDGTIVFNLPTAP